MICINKLTYTLSLVVICLVFGCKSDITQPTVVTTPIVLNGDWNMVEAYKGNNKSRLLDNGTFKFSPDGKFSTNILGDENLYAYQLDKGKISIDNLSKDTYFVQHKTADTLILTTRLRNFDFKFVTVLSKKSE